ncbi:MAG: hypothetical protein JSV96_07170 [Candidatus Aminicenantes bacterium]|nr:MAG: hypothetical protein JSV96_07170 [Candidatus Aminicenantes bacterium]
MRKRDFSHRVLLVLCIGFVLCIFLGAKKAEKKPVPLLTEAVLDGLKWRCIGPANMGGRIDDFAVVESSPHIIYAGTASGGVWKTTNNGVTWEPIFDDQPTSTIGDVTVSPSDPDIVWVGTGEPNNRQSSSWGNGVYKSTDGGKTWKNMGLKDTHHIGRLVIHPANPDIVYVAALGHLWGPNKERGLFKTADGGKTWVNTKFIDENTGFVDVAMDHENPNTLYAAAYQRRRRGWGFNGGGPGSGLFKTTDGGETWIRLTSGLPAGDTGRIGIDIFRSNPSIVYAVIENRRGGVFRSEDKGLSWKKMSSTNPRPMYYSKIRIDPNNDQRIWVLGARMYVSEDGGKTFNTSYVRGVHGDHHAMWINPENSNNIVLGSDGGIYFSYDRGKTWDFINTLPLGQFYEIGFDMRTPYYIYGGLQDNGSWGSPTSTWNRLGVTNEDWFRIGGGDGFYTQVDPTDYNTIYAESQNGNLFRLDLRTGESKSIRPQPEDEKESYRFNWNSPILISPHDHNTIYYGGNKLFKSKDRGETWEASIDLTTQQDREKLPLMGVLPDRRTLSRHDGISYFGDITTISESPIKEGLLYAGTDDGNLQVSRDGGKTWKNVISKIPGVPKNTYVTRVVASRFGEGTAYATLDGHRNDDYKAYVFTTTNYGESWKDISRDLPKGSIVNVIREHHRNPNLLFIGTERGAYFSTDRGISWIKFKGNFPLVPVDDIAIHPRENDLIFGTHGRSIWILDDITPLEQLTKENLASPAYLFDIRKAIMFNPYNRKGNLGHKFFVAPNPPFGAMISYYLKEQAKDSVEIIVQDSAGQMIREVKGSKNKGINRIAWNLRYGPPPVTREADRRFSSRGPFVLPGKYQVTLKAAGQEMTKTVEVEGDKRIEISFEERKAQHDALLKIYKLNPSLLALSRTTNNIKNEMQKQNTALKKVSGVPEAVIEHIKAISKEIDDIRIKLLGDPQLGRRGMRFSIRGQLSTLGRSIGGFTGAPSERQIQQISKNSEELETLIERANRIIEADIPKLNKLMNENNIPRIFPPKKIKKD